MQQKTDQANVKKTNVASLSWFMMYIMCEQHHAQKGYMNCTNVTLKLDRYAQKEVK